MGDEGPSVSQPEPPAKLAFLLNHGSFNPVHKHHIDMMVQSKKRLERQGYKVLGGSMAITNADFIKRKKEAEPLLEVHRTTSLTLACESAPGPPGWLKPDFRGVDFLSAGRMIQKLIEDEMPGVTVFTVVGADTVAKLCQNGSKFLRPMVVVGRAGSSSKVVREAAENSEAAGAAVYYVDELPGVVSSARAREALLADDEKAVKALCPAKAAEYLFENRMELYRKEFIEEALAKRAALLQLKEEAAGDRPVLATTEKSREKINPRDHKNREKGKPCGEKTDSIGVGASKLWAGKGRDNETTWEERHMERNLPFDQKGNKRGKPSGEKGKPSGTRLKEKGQIPDEATQIMPTYALDSKGKSKKGAISNKGGYNDLHIGKAGKAVGKASKGVEENGHGGDYGDTPLPSGRVACLGDGAAGEGKGSKSGVMTVGELETFGSKGAAGTKGQAKQRKSEDDNDQLPTNSGKGGAASPVLDSALVVGISGAPSAGKSSLARELQKSLVQKHGFKACSLISQQDFHMRSAAKRGAWIWKDSQWLENWESPDGIDWDALEKAVLDAAQENATVIVEGNSLFCSQRFSELLSSLIWIDLDEDTCWQRRSAYPKGWWAATYFRECIWPGHLQHLDEALGRQKSAPGCGGRSAAIGPSRTLGLNGTDRPAALRERAEKALLRWVGSGKG